MTNQKLMRVRIFLWDQLVRPLYLIFSTHQLKPILLSLMIINFIIFKSSTSFFVLSFLLAIIFSYELYNYWKSGEFMKNYREYKYPEYREAIKKIKESKHLNSLNDLNKDE